MQKFEIEFQRGDTVLISASSQKLNFLRKGFCLRRRIRRNLIVVVTKTKVKENDECNHYGIKPDFVWSIRSVLTEKTIDYEKLWRDKI